MTGPDGSQYENDGTPQGDASWVSDYGGVYTLDGDEDYIEIASDSSLDGGWSEITIEHWVKLSETGNGMKIVSKRGSVAADRSYQTGFQSSSPDNRAFLGLYLSDGYGEWSSSDSLENDRWYHLAFTWESGVGYHMYIDGVEDTGAGFGDGSVITGIVPVSDGEPLYIGSRLGTSYWLSGLVDDVRIYSEALTGADVAQRYSDTLSDHTEPNQAPVVFLPMNPPPNHLSRRPPKARPSPSPASPITPR